MSEHATTEPTSARFIHVEAQADHLESLARGKPVTALAELVWNALDADADRIRKSINAAGFDADDSPAPAEAVAKLDGCCRKK